MRASLLRKLAVAVGMTLVVAAVFFSPSAEAGTPTVTVGSVSTGVGLQGVVDLDALGIGAPGLGAWTIEIAYDPEVAAVVECTAEQGGICNAAYAEGIVRVAGTNVNGLEGDHRLARITLACQAAGESDLTLTLRVLADATLGSPAPIDAAVADGAVTCSEEDGHPSPTPKPTEPPGAPANVPGDANCDGAANAVDAALILQFDAHLTGSLPCQDAADVNGDGVVNAIDAAIILQRNAGLLT
jgi:hypothetical protein